MDIRDNSSVTQQDNLLTNTRHCKQFSESSTNDTHLAGRE